MKNIVLCFDGTDSLFGPDPFTNLLKLFRLLERDSQNEQICYYQPGIGTYMQIDPNGSGRNDFWNSIDSLVAFSLDVHIMKAYTYLMRFYEDGDKLYLFGFSRGAFTVRVLCSMIERVGLLNRGLEDLVKGAWGIYSAWEYAAQPSQPDYTTTLIDEFRMTFSRSPQISIEFLGLFECVNSVGLFRDRMFPYSSRFKYVKQIRHAVSIDERRVKYKENLLYPNPRKRSIFSPPNGSQKLSTNESKTHSTVSINESETDERSSGSSRLYEAKKMIKDIENRLKASVHLKRSNSRLSSNSIVSYDKSKLLNGEFQEIWFPGNHSDVGGGWNPDINGQFISNLALRWIISEAIKNGVLFNKEKVVEFSQRYSSLDSFLSPSHDVLKFTSNGLTHESSTREQTNILRLANTVTGKYKSIPYFRSCDIPKSVEELMRGGHNLIQNVRQIKFDILDSEKLSAYGVISKLFSHYKSLPTEKIRVTDGHGTNGFFTTLFWWSLEFIPFSSKFEDKKTSKWRVSYTPNFGRCRILPMHASLHWSVFWRMKYSFDYHPKNLPEYVKRLLSDETAHPEELFVDCDCSDDENLLKKVEEETKQLLRLWELAGWKTTPDDLADTLKEFDYI